MAPTQDQYEVALGALRADADTWEQCAADLDAAKGTAGGLDLEALHFSYVADKLGVTAIYQQFQDKLVRLLDEGRTMSTAVAAALRASAQTYQEEEEAGVHRMNNIW
ncbi:hypothetical protein [Actinophytocola xanthii]|uniref:ESX-1 secretion-associated protein n=1 Tax=Actinophytocola xanthii TaxID=1912961 RepID=A0A1Q8BUP0_9PSEU|nr:hypothetical protein [Actinophytocola xanthii]OLF05801.1 hypothetical protein BU204_36865 [Actinophytocola xanthii]